MARSVAEINDYIVTNLVTNFASAGITIDPTLWSKRNLLRMICYTIAISQALVEQLQDLFIANVEDVVAKSAAASAAWVQAKMFSFQYSPTVPQIIALINTVPQYPVVDTTLCIIDACSVTSDLSNTVLVKVATGNPLQALDSLELSAAQGYINTIGVVGINYSVVSLDPDRIYIEADVYFRGQYSAIIQQSVQDAITNFLVQQAVINFNGKIKMSDLEETIRDVAGVDDVVLNAVRGRQNSVPYANGIDLIVDSAVINRQWSTVAGYSIPEDDPTHTLTDSLNFITV